MDFNFAKVAVGDQITFRNGGVSVVREVNHNGGGEFYPIQIKIEGYHAGEDWWSYDGDGIHGEGTGGDGEHDFDVLVIEREAMSMMK